MEKKFLSELMKDVKLDKNTLIVSPTGSGKTHYIVNELSNNNKVLYLCDNSNLEEQVSKEDHARIFKDMQMKLGFSRTDIQVMTYKYFGMKIRYDLDDDFIQQFKIVICDEIHNLIDYQTFNNDGDLLGAIKTLMRKYDDTLIYMFTATPHYLDELKNRYSNIDKNYQTIDFSRHKEIKRFISLSTVEFSSYKQIPKMFENNRDNFEFFGKKALIYTTSIDTMKTIEESLNKEFLKPICIWSMNNTKHIMSDEQKSVRKHLIESGKLKDPYNVLIINRATETGINIIDKEMMYCVINTTNVTQQVQARGRIRHDIVELRLRSTKVSAGKENIKITLDDKWLDVPLTKEDKDKLVLELNLYDRGGRLMKWNAIKSILISKSNQYKLTDKTIRIDNKKVRITIIE